MSSLDEISRSIGVLQAQVAALATQQTAHVGEAARIRDQVTEMTVCMRQIQVDVAEFKPAARKIQKWEQRGIGIGLFGGLIGSWIAFHFKGWFG